MPSSYVVGSHFEQFIKDQISGGRYQSASEVVRDALRLLEHEEQRLWRRFERKYSNHSAVLVEP